MSSYGEMGQTTIEPELQGRTPRRVRYAGSTQVVRLFVWLLLIVVMSLIAHFGLKDMGELKALRAGGTTGTATVTGEHATGGRSTTYYLDYIFQANGSSVSDDESVSRSVYDDTNTGTTLTVTYLPEDPNIHRVGVVDDHYIHHSVTLWLGGAAAVFLLLGLFVLFTERRFQDERTLLADGVAVTGRITNRSMVQGSKSNSYYVEYEFDGPGGTVSGKISVSRARYNETNSGTAATILYNPLKPNDNRPYYILRDDVRLA